MNPFERIKSSITCNTRRIPAAAAGEAREYDVEKGREVITSTSYRNFDTIYGNHFFKNQNQSNQILTMALQIAQCVTDNS